MTPSRLILPTFNQSVDSRVYVPLRPPPHRPQSPSDNSTSILERGAHGSPLTYDTVSADGL